MQSNQGKNTHGAGARRAYLALSTGEAELDTRPSPLRRALALALAGLCLAAFPLIWSAYAQGHGGDGDGSMAVNSSGHSGSNSGPGSGHGDDDEGGDGNSGHGGGDDDDTTTKATATGTTRGTGPSNTNTNDTATGTVTDPTGTTRGTGPSNTNTNDTATGTRTRNGHDPTGTTRGPAPATRTPTTQPPAPALGVGDTDRHTDRALSPPIAERRGRAVARPLCLPSLRSHVRTVHGHQEGHQEVADRFQVELEKALEEKVEGAMGRFNVAPDPGDPHRSLLAGRGGGGARASARRG